MPRKKRRDYSKPYLFETWRDFFIDPHDGLIAMLRHGAEVLEEAVGRNRRQRIVDVLLDLADHCGMLVTEEVGRTERLYRAARRLEALPNVPEGTDGDLDPKAPGTQRVWEAWEHFADAEATLESVAKAIARRDWPLVARQAAYLAWVGNALARRARAETPEDIRSSWLRVAPEAVNGPGGAA